MATQKITVNGVVYELKDGMADANGQKIHYVEMGEGPMILMVHGFPEYWYVWKNQIPVLAEAGFRVVAMDMRGFGRSSKPENWTDYLMHDVAKDCAELVTALGEEKAIIIGHDWGGIISWTAAWLYPEKFRGVACLSNVFGGYDCHALPLSLNPDRSKLPSQMLAEMAGPGKMFYSENFSDGTRILVTLKNMKNWLFNAYFGWSHLVPCPPQIKEKSFMDITNDEMIEMFRNSSLCMERYGPAAPAQRLNVPNPYFLPEEDLEEMAAMFEATGLKHGLYLYKCADLDYQILKGIEERITIPAFYIGGDRDWTTMWSRDAIKELPNRCDDLRGCVILENCGHWIEMEYPEKVNELLLGFVKGI